MVLFLSFLAPEQRYGRFSFCPMDIKLRKCEMGHILAQGSNIDEENSGPLNVIASLPNKTGRTTTLTLIPEI